MDIGLAEVPGGRSLGEHVGHYSRFEGRDGLLLFLFVDSVGYRLPRFRIGVGFRYAFFKMSVLLTKPGTGGTGEDYNASARRTIIVEQVSLLLSCDILITEKDHSSMCHEQG